MLWSNPLVGKATTRGKEEGLCQNGAILWALFSLFSDSLGDPHQLAADYSVTACLNPPNQHHINATPLHGP
jgi:hypothetical protein